MWSTLYWITGQVAIACAAVLAYSVLGHTATIAVEAQELEPEPLYATPTRLDRAGRVVAAVEVNGQGPFRFIVDTGANRSAISAGLVERLQLPFTGGTTVGVHGVTGFAELPAVEVESLRVGSLEFHGRRVPVLPSAVLADADGILGVEGLQDARIEVDFSNDSVSIHRSVRRRALPGSLIVPARLEKGGLLVVRGRVGNVRAQVIIDTGAERSIGNLRLADALAHATNQAARSESIVVGATPGSVTASAYLSPPISIGDARLRDLMVTFGDLHVFSVWGLEDEPAILVGMDVLGTLQQLVIDYARREFQFKPHREQSPSVNMCSQTGCGSRLPRGGR